MVPFGTGDLCRVLAACQALPCGPRQSLWEPSQRPSPGPVLGLRDRKPGAAGAGDSGAGAAARLQYTFLSLLSVNQAGAPTWVPMWLQIGARRRLLRGGLWPVA